MIPRPPAGSAVEGYGPEASGAHDGGPPAAAGVAADASHRDTFTLIQALRGIAASWVVLFHVYMAAGIPALAAALPAAVTYGLFGYGSAGVGIFFVLSGFVIAHTLHGRPLSGAGFGGFVLRRSIRLDTCYWVSILVVLAVEALLAIAHHQPWSPPSVGAVAAHLLYLQEYLRVPEIQVVYWTLTYEVQFYAVLAAAHWLSGRLPARWARVPFFVLTALAFGAATRTGGDIMPGLFVNLWHGFFVGVLAYEAGYRRRSPLLLLALAAVMLVAARFQPSVFGTPCAVTALVLFAAARSGFLRNGLAARPWQLLGLVSYSLYLVHVPVVRLVGGLCARAWGHSATRDLASLIVQLAAVVAAATLLWWLVERPSQHLARRWTRGIGRSDAARPERQLV